MITVEGINTKPEKDLYQNIEGVCTTTTFWLDPRDRTCGARQDSQDNSTLMDEWNGLVLTARVCNHPKENTMQRWIDENTVYLDRVCSGFESVWNGNNHIGKLTDEAENLWSVMADELENDVLENYYEFWSVESWLESSRDEITADMTDEQLKEFSDGCEATGDIIVGGDILEFITQVRNTLKFEKENSIDDFEEDSPEKYRAGMIADGFWTENDY